MKTVVTYDNDTYSFAVIAAEKEDSIHLLTEADTVQLVSNAVDNKRDKREAIANALADKPSLFNDLQDLAYEHELEWDDVVNLAMPVGTVHLFHERHAGADSKLLYLSNTGQGLMQAGYLYSQELKPLLVADPYLYPYHATVDDNTLTNKHAKPAPQSLLLLTLFQVTTNIPHIF